MKYSLLLSFCITFSFFSCSASLVQDFSDQDPKEIFEEFWSYVDENYIYFELKNVDWNRVKDEYESRITDDMTEEALFDLCNEALLELKDGHNRILSSFKNPRSFRFNEGYEIHFSRTVIEDNYIKGTLQSDGNIRYGMLNSGQAYVSLLKMSNYINFVKICKELEEHGATGLVIDIRNNTGGDSNPIPDMLRYFVDEPTYIGAYVEKSGKGHKDVTDPLGMIVEPATNYKFNLPISLLTNRWSFSASSYMAAMFGALDNVSLVGQVTGGGGGGNLSYQLSNGWIVAVSVSDYLDVEGMSIEPGVRPDVIIENTKEDIQKGQDIMLEKAIEI